MSHTGTIRSGDGNPLYPAGQYATSEDSNFVSGDSPATYNANSDLGKNANNGYIICDGAGDITVNLSQDGTTFGDNITLTSGDEFSLKGRNVHSIKLTHVSDSAYRIYVE